jgi:HPt (histidine-containing phosphotransfer) domain-containing protein
MAPTSDQLDHRLQRLRDASGRIGANLVELEVDSSRQLLEASGLTGESAARWSAASATLTELWQWHGLLQALVERAAGLRGGRHADELRALLEGPSIELSITEVPLAERDLLAGPEATERCSPDELLVRMSRAFDQVKAVIAQIGAVWEALIPRLEAARRVLADSAALAAELGEAGRGDLDQASHQLAGLSATVSADPLAVAPATVDAVARSLDAIHADLDASAALKREFDARVAGARSLLDELRRAITDGQAAHREVTVKISVPAAPAALEIGDGVERELAELITVARGGGWREARRMLDAWTASAHASLEDAQRILAANRAPIQARNDFRSLLEAYQVKAKRLGLLEDPAAASIFDQAHEALYNAPTDLALVGQLIRRYQELLSGSPSAPSTPEALR